MFAAAVDDPQCRSGLFRWRDGKLVAIALEDTPLRGGGRLGFVSSLALRGSLTAFTANIFGNVFGVESVGTGLFVARKHARRPLVRDGDATPLGGGFLNAYETLSFAGPAVVYAVELPAARSRRALLAAVFAEPVL